MIVPLSAARRAPKKPGGIRSPGTGGVPPTRPPSSPPSNKLDKMVNALLGTPVYKAFVRANGGRDLPVIKLSFDVNSPEYFSASPRQYLESLAGLNSNQYVVFGVEKTTGKKQKEYYLIIDERDNIMAKRELFFSNRLGLNSFSCFLHLMEEEEKIHLHMVALLHPQMRGHKLMRESIDQVLRSSFAGKTITAHAENIGIIPWFAKDYNLGFMQRRFIDNDRNSINPSVYNYGALAANLEEIGVLSPSAAKEIAGQTDISDAYPLLEQKLEEKCGGVSPLQYLCDIIREHSFDVVELPLLPIQGVVPGPKPAIS